ncbi:MAG TPA: DUF4232 domain-containing protein [Conexibacter sp.]|jgi:hypothetical protein|nr:DUF4232 domain-containing protein [Conexibacter sp.]
MLRPIPRYRASRRLGLAAATAAVALAATAALPAVAPAARAPRCTVSMLLGELRAPSAGAGQRQAKLLLTNVTRRTCSLAGYPGGLLLGATNIPLPTNVVRDTGHRARVVTLTPGQSAKTTVQWGVITGSGDRQTGACEPTPARIEITPPNASGHLVLPWRNGPVCERGRIVVNPVTHA